MLRRLDILPGGIFLCVHGATSSILIEITEDHFHVMPLAAGPCPCRLRLNQHCCSVSCCENGLSKDRLNQ